MAETFVMPEGRLINGHFFARATFTDEQGREGKPMYKSEAAYPDDDTTLEGFKDYLWDTMVETYGTAAVDLANAENRIDWPIRNGDKLKARREAKGKAGDAYGGMEIVRASSLFNKDGFAADGGIDVYDEQAEEIPAVKQNTIYNGCQVIVALKAKSYSRVDRDIEYLSCALYLEAVQKTDEGDRLQAQTDRSGLFQPKSKGGTGGRTGGRRTTGDVPF